LNVGQALALTNLLPSSILLPRRTTLATLHVEHPITDFAAWKAAFDRFADKRADAGVTAH
jgi:hypothetical protein